MKVFIKTFGCRTNIYDSELLKSYVKDAQICANENEADFIVINSCTVTNNADLGLKQYINHVKNHNKNARFLLTGCAAASIGKNLFDSKIVDGVLGASQKSQINTFFKNPRFDLGNLKFIDEKIVSNYENHTKAFVKIQEGCDFACSYCIIPSVRGKARSNSPEQIVKQAEVLAMNGYSELVLTGTNIGSYGKDIGLNLAKLLKKLSQIPKIKRIRLGSLEPVQLDDEFMELLDEPWLERHLHIALQHTSEEMLRLMRRRNHFKHDLALFENLASRGYALGTDFIVGHPGESDELWREAVANFAHFHITHLHAFIYSKRDGTHSVELAKKLGEIDNAKAKARLHEIRLLASQNNYKFRQKQGALDVLFEQYKDGFYQGYDQFFNLVRAKSEKDLRKTWAKIDEYQVKENGNFCEIL